MAAITSIVEAACECAARGWRVVRLYGAAGPGICTCAKGADCPSAGKHPDLGLDWQHQASHDLAIVAAWYAQKPDANVGVLLGPQSGLIDIECDSPEAERDLLELFAGDPPLAPTFTGRRGKHRLFAWRAGLPNQAVVKWRAVEIRLGAGGAGAQSVCPPSVHGVTGQRYEWLPGCGPDDLPLGELPDSVVARLGQRCGPAAGNGEPEKKGKSPYRRAVLARKVIPPGTHHFTLRDEAVALWGEAYLGYGEACWEHPDRVAWVYRIIELIARVQLQRHDLTDEAIMKYVIDARDYVRNEKRNEHLANDDERWSKIRRALANLPVARIAKIGKTDSDYVFVLTDGEQIHVGRLAQDEVRRAVRDATRHFVVPRVAVAQWDKLTTWMAALADEQLVAEEDMTAEIKGWIEEYLADNKPAITEEDIKQRRDRQPFVRAGRLHLSVPALLEYMRVRGYPKNWEAGRRVKRQLKWLGYEHCEISERHEGRVRRRSYWAISHDLP